MTTKTFSIGSFHPKAVEQGNSTPLPVGISSSIISPVPARVVEHPQALSTTVETGFPPVVPLNDSILATGFPLESPSDPAEAPE